MSYELRVKKQKEAGKLGSWEVMKSQLLNFLTSYLLIFFFLFLTSNFLLPTLAAAKWGGVDESVVEKYAGEHGRAPGEPVINTDQGDILLFLFLLGGAVAGFAGGYYWRQLTESGAKNSEHKCRGNS